MTSVYISRNTKAVLAEGTPPLQALAIHKQALIDGAPNLIASSTSKRALIDGNPATHISMSVLQALVEPIPDFQTTEINQCVLAEGANLTMSSMHSALVVLYDITQLSPNTEEYNPVSDYLFPTLAGLTWNIVKKPKFSTVIAPHVSGREVRVSNYSYPLWEWDMTYEFLRADSHNELQTLMGFFLQRQGSFDTFLYKDANEVNVIVGGSVGAGDGALTKYTFYKTYAGFTEPIGYVNPATLHVFFTVGGVTTEQTTGWTFVSPNQIVFDVPPATGTTITASYTWYYRVRFGEDAQDYSNFMYQLWELKKLTLQSVKP